jgi:putative hydrolase of the HAD superfamily
MIKAVFFDMYGTLAGFQPSRYEVQSQACAHFGLKVTPEGILRGYAAADAYMSEQNAVRPLRLRDAHGRDELFAEYERLVLLGSGVEVTQERALAIFRRLRQTPYKLAPFDDAVPTLRRLKSMGLTLGLISNIDRDGDELADSLGLADYLDFAVTSTEVNAEKPAPPIFRAALRKAGASPEEAVHVGDQPTSDVEGALAVGVSPVLLDRDGNHTGFSRCPRIESLLELSALLEGDSL